MFVKEQAKTMRVNDVCHRVAAGKLVEVPTDCTCRHLAHPNHLYLSKQVNIPADWLCRHLAHRNFLLHDVSPIQKMSMSLWGQVQMQQLSVCPLLFEHLWSRDTLVQVKVLSLSADEAAKMPISSLDTRLAVEF